MNETMQEDRLRSVEIVGKTLMRVHLRRRILVFAGIALCLTLLMGSAANALAADARFEISYPASLDQGPITGRVFV